VRRLAKGGLLRTKRIRRYFPTSRPEVAIAAARHHARAGQGRGRLEIAHTHTTTLIPDGFVPTAQ
jgi:hypothetical protein